MDGVFPDPYGVTLKRIQHLGIDSELMENIRSYPKMFRVISEVFWETSERFRTLSEMFR
jgi:hypothetical protein